MKKKPEGKNKVSMFLNLTYVPTPWRLEGKALGFILTSDHVPSAGDRVKEFIMFNTS